MDQLIKTIAPVWESTKIDSSRQGGEIGNQLRAILKSGRVLDSAIDRVGFSSDASFYSLVPQAIAQPATLEEISALFRFSRTRKIPLVFRAGGTSLSGQAITNGVLVDIARYWRRSEVQEGGRAIRVQPGVIGQVANDSLKPYGAKIGPDPASISVARVGGILSNNASGMCCGVTQNAYHTLRSMKLMLPSGTIVDTGQSDCESALRHLEPKLCSGLLNLKTRIERDATLAERIRLKYRMKNTTGYSLNAFLDFDTPAQILSHLMIGAEGTLGFIAEAILETIPDMPLKYTGLLVFSSIHSACGAIVPLRESGAATIELMDRASLRSVEKKPGMAAVLASLPDSAAALLVEFHAATLETDQLNRLAAVRVVQNLDLLVPARLTAEETEQAQLWSIRKGLFPSVGAVRARGTSVIIEDIAVPIEQLADAATDLTTLFKRHGYSEAILFGHAKDGNLHFVITQGFDTSARVAQYRAFIEDVVSLVVHRFDGSLKAEHGTGRNMAPFVQSEWGPEALVIMRELKSLIDPEGLLNPGVILNPHSDAHIRDLKLMPEVEPEIDKCIECGYCEPKCPSRDLTLTPRQRIVVRRTMERLGKQTDDLEMRTALDRDFPYMVLDTCAVDGLCATSCPVDIDTGSLTKRLRVARHSRLAHQAALAMAQHFSAVEVAARLALGAGHLVQSFAGLAAMNLLTRAFDLLSRKVTGEPFWKWCAEMPHPRKGRVPSQIVLNPEAVYFPTCISRIMGALPAEADNITVMDALLSIAQRAGVRLFVPHDVQGLCCGVPFSSKGFDRAHVAAANQTVESFFRWSNGGAVPIVLDTSPCTYGLKTCRVYLTPKNQERFDVLTILDSIEFVSQWILPKLVVRRRIGRVAVHPVCSVVNMRLTGKLTQVMNACSEEVVVPRDGGCCAFAGDRGFLFPELTATATETVASQIRQQPCDAYFSSSKTCEIGMTRATGQVYRSYLHLLEYASRLDEA